MINLIDKLVFYLGKLPIMLVWVGMLLGSVIPRQLPAQTAIRGGIEFTLANMELIKIGSHDYLCLDLMASSPEPNQRLGTGIVLLNYNPEVFGFNVRANGNLIVTGGELILPQPFSLYHLITNDNSPTRLAVTFEYTPAVGGGGLLSTSAQRMVNIKLKVLNTGFCSGLSFQPDMMANEQYLNDNATLFHPVLLTDIENCVIPAKPTISSLTFSNNNFCLSWQQLLNCFFTVWSADYPDSDEWQVEAAGISEPVWTIPATANRKFFRVTATGNPCSRN